MKLYDDLVYRGLIKDITNVELEGKLNNGGITFYIGTDPTADSLHLGHLSSFLISKRLKDAGHNPLLLVGGATGLIGDPRPTSERTIITKEDLNKNILGIKNQVNKLFGFEIVDNYDWSKDINFIDYLRDYGKYFNINYMLDKDIIRRRLDTGITYTEFSYMIMQSLDFLYLYENRNCTLQVAGSDQWGNITAGIDLIRKKGGEAFGFTMPLILDKNGNKFGKSEGNALWLDIDKTSAYDLYQYLINVDDSKVVEYLKVFTFLEYNEIERLAECVLKEPDKREAQSVFAREVITFIHGVDAYNTALNISKCLFSSDVTSLSADDIINSLTDVLKFEIEKGSNIIDILVENGICSSKREAREMVNSNAISINNELISEVDFTINNGIDDRVILIRKGKKKYYLGLLK